MRPWLLSLLACACAAAQDNFINFTLNGTVPPNALFATMGPRANVECLSSDQTLCVKGYVDIVLSSISYIEPTGGNRAPNGDFAKIPNGLIQSSTGTGFPNPNDPTKSNYYTLEPSPTAG